MASVTSLSPLEPAGPPPAKRNRYKEGSVAGAGSGPAVGRVPAGRGRTGARAAAVALVALEACALLGVVVWWVVGTLRGGDLRGSELFLAAFALGVAAVLVTAARALALGRRGARGPIVTWQVLQAATATTVVGVPGARVWAVAAVAGSAVVVLLVLAPGVAAVRPGPDGPPERA